MPFRQSPKPSCSVVRLRVCELEERTTPAHVGLPTEAALRAALAEVNAGDPVLTFVSPMTIELTQPLPTITQRVSIIAPQNNDGTPGVVLHANGVAEGLHLQRGGRVENMVISGFAGPGLRCDARAIVLNNYIGTTADGLAANSNGGTGLTMTAGGIVRGNLISGNLGDGLIVEGPAVIVEDNKFGTDVTGMVPLMNGESGLELWGSRSLVRNNIISGNGESGIRVLGLAAARNRIVANHIGVNETGTEALPNAGSGIFVGNEAHHNVIGGRAEQHANVISGNDGNGIHLGYLATKNSVLGNIIGLDRNGLEPLGNQGAGVLLEGASANTIHAGNVIAANVQAGVHLTVHAVPKVTSSKNRIFGNLIGVDKDGLGRGNEGGGILLDEGSTANDIGGTSPNVVSANVAFGLRLTGVGTAGNRVWGNNIGTHPDGTAFIESADLNPLPLGVGILVDAGASANHLGRAGVSPNVISGNQGAGVWIMGANTTANRLVGNYIGVDRKGTSALANDGAGVLVEEAPQTVVGIAGHGNVLSGNMTSGLVINGASGGSDLAVQVVGNFIGTDAQGLLAIPNAKNGIVVTNAHHTLIGGTSAAGRNVIAGNTQDGVVLTGATRFTRIEGNFIGVDRTGKKALGNQHGIFVNNAGTGNAMGGSKPTSRNVIAANAGDGIHIENTSEVTILTNFIGTDRTGRQPLGNAGHGVFMRGSSSHVGNGTHANGNVIAFNQLAGVYVDAGTGHRVEGNTIFANGLDNIDLLTGTNNDLTTTITNAVTGRGKVTLQGTVFGTIPVGNQTVALELFGNQEPDPAFERAGTRFLSRLAVVVQADGTFTATFATRIPASYRFLTITASNAHGTSEFSDAFSV